MGSDITASAPTPPNPEKIKQYPFKKFTAIEETSNF